MKLQTVIAFLLVIPAALTLHAKDKKPVGVPAVFGQARYVYVKAMDGNEFDPNLDTQDRMAIADVRDALARWKRYAVATSMEDADLVIVVRKGRIASANAGIAPRPGQFPNGANRQGGMGSAEQGDEVGTEIGPADDLFDVCTVNASGRLGAPMWHRSLPDGLTAPRVALLEQFEEAVDKAYPQQPATPPNAQPQPAQPQPGQQKP